MPRLTGQMLADVVGRKGATASSLDGWGWRELKILPVSWFDELARILTKVEDLGVWPEGLLDAYIAMIPKADGDATHLGQRPLSVLPVVYRIWASARMGQLDGWFKSWVPDSGRGRAMLGSTVSTCSASVLGWFLEEFHDFLREGVDSDPEVDSRRFSLLPRSSSTTAVVCILLVLLVLMHLGCVPDDCGRSACTR